MLVNSFGGVDMSLLLILFGCAFADHPSTMVPVERKYSRHGTDVGYRVWDICSDCQLHGAVWALYVGNEHIAQGLELPKHVLCPRS